MDKKIVVSLPNEILHKHIAEMPGVEALLWRMDSKAPRQEINIVVPPYLDGNKTLAQLHGIETNLVQWQSIGYDGVADYLPEGTPFANAATVHETSTAELAVGLAIAAQRGIDESARAMTQKFWDPQHRPSLADSRVLLLGYGGVAKATEKRLLPFEVDIVRVATSSRKETLADGQEVHVHGLEHLESLLGDANIVISSLPLNDKTNKMFDAKRLAQMSDGALLINVGRGGVVDTDALAGELNSERLRAALDVVDPEPLPADHPLWAAPNLLITPHNGGNTSAMTPRLVALIKRQIEHLQKGEEFENLINFT